MSSTNFGSILILFCLLSNCLLHLIAAFPFLSDTTVSFPIFRYSCITFFRTPVGFFSLFSSFSCFVLFFRFFLFCYGLACFVVVFSYPAR